MKVAADAAVMKAVPAAVGTKVVATKAVQACAGMTVELQCRWARKLLKV
jgi:uncharacterized membrane protein